jgi:hypothetical protein
MSANSFTHNNLDELVNFCEKRAYQRDLLFNNTIFVLDHKISKEDVIILFSTKNLIKNYINSKKAFAA